MQKFQRAISNPGKVLPYVKREVQRKWLEKCYGPVLHQDVFGNKMELDLRDPGIATDLAISGIREPLTTASYITELRRIANEKGKPLMIVEIGANIGYYVLVEASALEKPSILAIELDEENIANLQKNIMLNNLDDQVTVVQKAVGSKNETTELVESTHSNFHTLQTNNIDQTPHMFQKGGTIQVQTLPEILNSEGIEPSEIDAIRMDVEGYEAKILEGMEPLLKEYPLLLHIEVHPTPMDEEELEYLISILKDVNSTILSSARDEKVMNVWELNDLRSSGWVELIIQTDPQ